MAILAVAMLDTPGAVTPVVVVPAICKAPRKYFVVVALLGSMFLMRHLLSGAMALLPVAWRFGIYLPIEFFTLDSLIVSSRSLGLLYRDSGEQFGWLN
jgi:hypothetical protein